MPCRSKPNNFLDRFTPIPECGCFIWDGAITTSGYGQVGYHGRKHRTHKLSWEIHNGRPVPEGMCVLHHCDTPLCGNPSHLFLGTVNDNHKDMDKKKRRRVGEKHGRAKLSLAQVLEIINSSESYLKLSNHYKVSVQNICKIKTKQIWRHINHAI